VLDAQGQPVVGAKVSTGGVSMRNIGRTEWLFSELFGAMFPVETDDQGRYRLTGLPPGQAQIHARTADMVSRAPAQADLAIAETETGIEVRVEEAFKVSGFVVDDDNPGEGMADVLVLVQPDGAVTTPTFGTTDDSGYFEVDGLMPGNYRIFAAGGTAAPLILEDVVTVADADVEDVLVRAKIGWAVSGRISPPDRAGVRLEPASYGRDTAGALRYAATSMARAEVDEEGTFRFSSVADGDYVVVVTTIDGEGRVPVTVSGAEVKELSVDVAPLSAMKGRVVDDTGAPVVGTVVAATAKNSSVPNAYATQLHTRDRTDREGRYEIIGLHPASYQVRVFDGTGQRAWATAEEDEAFDPRVVEVASGVGTETVDLQVSSKGIRIDGIVVGLDGSPVEDAWVEVKARSSRNAPAGHKQMPVLTDGSGRFVVRGLFGDKFEAQATGPRGKLESARVKTQGAEPVTLKLSTLSTVLATVKRDGKLVTDFEVDVSDGPSRVIGRMVEKKNGTFELPRLISGEYKIEVKSGDSYAQRVVTVGPAPTTAVELELQPTSSVRGRLLDENGDAVIGAAPTISGATLNMDRGEFMVGRSRPRTGPDGSFEVKGLIAGSGRIIFMRSEQGVDPVAFAEFELKPGEDLDLGTIQRGKRQSLADAPFDDTSEDLGIRFYAGPTPPTAEQLRQIAQADDPRSLLDKDNAKLWIAEIVAGSPAEQAGLRRGDSVLAVGRMQIGDSLAPADAMISLSQRWRSKGRVVEWTVERGGTQVSVPVLVPR
jgi:protocatechuate 3,4-dioxygenase beta subunit